MREFILENLTNTESLDFTILLLNNLVAFVAAFFLMITYRMTITNGIYSRTFNQSLGGIVIITTMIMSVISNNVALSLGMVGALSIIRFRTAVKDVRDATYIFWAIAVGIGCGVSQYTLIAVGSVCLFFFFIFTKKGFLSSKKLLVIQGELDALPKIEAAVHEFFEENAKLTMRNVSKMQCEFVYSIGEGLLSKYARKNQMDISEKLIQMDGIIRVNLIDQREELSQ